MSPGKKYKWILIAENVAAIEWQSNNMCILEVNGKKITLAQHNHQIFAFAHKCPHAGGVLADGFIDGAATIVCPLHRYKFNIQNGRNTTGEGYYLTTYPVEQRENGIYLGLEDKGFWGLF